MREIPVAGVMVLSVGVVVVVVLAAGGLVDGSPEAGRHDRPTKGETEEDALKGARNELGKGVFSDEAWGDKADAVAIAGWAGWKETTGC